MARPEFCPNASKSFHNPRGFSKTKLKKLKLKKLKKNNDELAKALNSHKSFIATLKAERNAKDREMMELREELAHVRAQVDPVMVEVEVKKALSLVLGPLKTVLNLSLDNVVSLSENLTQALTIVNNKGGQGRGSSTAASRQTDSMGATIQMRPVMPINRARQSTSEETINDDSTTAAETTAQTSVPNEMSTTSNTEVGRSKFDLTNIGELGESRVEESVMDSSGLGNSLAEESSSLPSDFHHSSFGQIILEESTSMDLSIVANTECSDGFGNGRKLVEPIQEEGLEARPLESSGSNESLDISIKRKVSNSRRSSILGGSFITNSRSSVSEAVSPIRTSVSRNSLTDDDTLEPSAKKAEKRKSIRKSLKASDAYEVNRNGGGRLSGSPIPSKPVFHRSMEIFGADESFPENPSDSFLERLAETDAADGPSWLFEDGDESSCRGHGGRLSTVLSIGSDAGRSARTTGASRSGSNDSNLNSRFSSMSSGIDRSRSSSRTDSASPSPVLAKLKSLFGVTSPLDKDESSVFSSPAFNESSSAVSSLGNTSTETSPNPAVSPRVNAAVGRNSGVDNGGSSSAIKARSYGGVKDGRLSIDPSCVIKRKAQSEDLQGKNKLFRRKSSRLGLSRQHGHATVRIEDFDLPLDDPPTPSPPVGRISVSSVKQPDNSNASLGNPVEDDTEETLKEKDSRMSNEQPIPEPPKSPVSCRLPPPAPPFSCPPVVRNAILVPSKHDSSRFSRLPGTLLKDAAIFNILRPEEEASQNVIQTSVSRTVDGNLSTISRNYVTPSATDPGAPSLAGDAKTTEEGSSKLPCDPLKSIVSEPLEKGLEVQPIKANNDGNVRLSTGSSDWDFPVEPDNLPKRKRSSRAFSQRRSILTSRSKLPSGIHVRKENDPVSLHINNVNSTTNGSEERLVLDSESNLLKSVPRENDGASQFQEETVKDSGHQAQSTCISKTPKLLSTSRLVSDGVDGEETQNRRKSRSNKCITNGIPDHSDEQSNSTSPSRKKSEDGFLTDSSNLIDSTKGAFVSASSTKDSSEVKSKAPKESSRKKARASSILKSSNLGSHDKKTSELVLTPSVSNTLPKNSEKENMPKKKKTKDSDELTDAECVDLESRKEKEAGETEVTVLNDEPEAEPVDGGGRSRRRAASGTISYKEKSLNVKMRRLSSELVLTQFNDLINGRNDTNMSNDGSNLKPSSNCFREKSVSNTLPKNSEKENMPKKKKTKYSDELTDAECVDLESRKEKGKTSKKLKVRNSNAKRTLGPEKEIDKMKTKSKEAGETEATVFNDEFEAEPVDGGGRSRRRAASGTKSYKEKSLNVKMRRL